MRNAEIALYDTGMQLQPQKKELYEANQVTDQTRRDKRWLLEKEKKQNFSERSCQTFPKLKDYEEFAVQKLKELYN